MADIKITELPQTTSVSDSDELIVQQSTGTKRTPISSLPAGVPDGGTTGQILTKQSSEDGDVDWENPLINYEETGSVPSPTPLNADQLEGHPASYFQQLLNAGNGIEINGNVISSFLNMDLLWTNSSSTSEFAEQTLNLNLSQYSLIYIVVKFSASSSSNVIGFLANTNFNGVILASHFRNYIRPANISSDSIVFGNCGYFATYGTNTRTTSNSNLIPIRIYGIK